LSEEGRALSRRLAGARVRAGLLSVRLGGAVSSCPGALSNKTGAGVPVEMVVDVSAPNETKGSYHMRFKARGVLLALVAVFVMSAIGAGSASAHEFVASKEGTLKNKENFNTVFTLNVGAFECKTETSEGHVTKGAQKAIIEKVQYKNCVIFGKALTVTPAEYEFGAEEWVSLLNKVVFTMSSSKCTITLEPTEGKDLNGASYANLAGGKLKVTSNMKNIAYKTAGANCGTGGQNGTETKQLEAELPGGTIEWK
jgi:hypothetical protein